MNILRCLESPALDEAANEPRDEPQGRIDLQGFLVANYDRLLRRLMRHLGCPELARECLHDAWLRLDDMDVRSPVQNPEAYVYRMACNLATDHLRHSRPWQFASDNCTELAYFADQAPGPDFIVEARSELAALDRALDCLPRRHLSVLVSLRLEDLTRQEAAVRHRISLRSVDTVLRQALDHCAREIDRPVTAGVRAPRRALRRMPARG